MTALGRQRTTQPSSDVTGLCGDYTVLDSKGITQANKLGAKRLHVQCFQLAWVHASAVAVGNSRDRPKNPKNLSSHAALSQT